MILSSGCDSSIKEKLKNKSNETKNYYLFFFWIKHFHVVYVYSKILNVLCEINSQKSNVKSVILLII